jgi:hypothetical protein
VPIRLTAFSVNMNGPPIARRQDSKVMTSGGTVHHAMAGDRQEMGLISWFSSITDVTFAG